jgi:pimeloyl-ACP methyl ester carboxylesterase
LTPARSQFIDLRGMTHHLLTWGDAAAPKLFMLHGWMDMGASFQFLVDALAGRWHVIAPDLRGFGASQWQPQGYWYADYIADLDALLDQLVPDEPVNLLGHSLGGNVAMVYAGVRPSRVRRVVSLDAFGLPGEVADVAPDKLAKWLDALKDPPAFAPYASLAEIAGRLQKNNPRLTRDKAQFLALHWGEELPDGSARLRSDPRHKLPFPSVYRMEEVYAIWRRITAPVLWVAASDSHVLSWLRGKDRNADPLAIVRDRMLHVSDSRLVLVDDASHMLHHDQPDAVAQAIEPFLADSRALRS